MPAVKLKLSPLGKVKFSIHILQTLLVAIALFVYIAMATKAGNSKAAGIYYIVLVLCTFPALIYLSAVPMWSRTQKLANVFVFMAIDTVFAILWLGAWAAFVAWVRAGIASGAAKSKIDHKDSNCTVFDPDFGTPAKCDLGNVCVGFGVAIFVAFIPTAVISYLFSRKTKQEPEVKQPWLGKQIHKGGDYIPTDPEEGTDGVWSSEMHDDTGYGGHGGAYDRPDSAGHANDKDDDDDEYRLLHGAGHEGHGPVGNEYGPSAGHRYTLSDDDRLNDRLEDDDTEYYGSAISGGGAYGQIDGRNDLDLPPYPATPYGSHVQPYGADSYGPPPNVYGSERPYQDMR